MIFPISVGRYLLAREVVTPSATAEMTFKLAPPILDKIAWEVELFGDKAVYITIPDTEEAEKKVKNATDYHLQATSQVREGNDGIMYRTYKLLRGSHTYNTEEMARLIDGLVQCCKDAGMPDADIASPDEKRILKERYGVDFG